MTNLKKLLENDDNKKFYRYLLLDMLGVTSELSSIYSLALKESLSSNEIAIISRPELLHDLSSCPHLICIGKPNENINESLLNASVRQIDEDFLVKKKYLCGWIVSEMNINDLSESITKVGVKIGSLLSSRFTPFYEPFRLQLLQDSNSKNPNWIGSFFPVGMTYYYPDAKLAIREIKSYESGQFPKLFLDPNIVFFQNELPKLFQIYVLWNEFQEKNNGKTDSNEVIEILEFYSVAYSLGLTNIGDITVFIFFSMQYGDISKIGKVKVIIEEVASCFPGTLSNKLKNIN